MEKIRKYTRTKHKQHYSKNKTKYKKRTTKNNKYKMKKTKTRICGGDNNSKSQLNAILLAMPDPYKPNEPISSKYIQYLINMVHTNPDNMKHIDEMVYLLKQHGNNKQIHTKITTPYEVSNVKGE